MVPILRSYLDKNLIKIRLLIDHFEATNYNLCSQTKNPKNPFGPETIEILSTNYFKN